jgi:hypothetical protein
MTALLATHAGVARGRRITGYMGNGVLPGALRGDLGNGATPSSFDDAQRAHAEKRQMDDPTGVPYPSDQKPIPLETRLTYLDSARSPAAATASSLSRPLSWGSPLRRRDPTENTTEADHRIPRAAAGHDRLMSAFIAQILDDGAVRQRPGPAVRARHKAALRRSAVRPFACQVPARRDPDASERDSMPTSSRRR